MENQETAEVTEVVGNIILETQEALAALKELIKSKDARILELEVLSTEALKYKTALEEIHYDLIGIVTGVKDEQLEEAVNALGEMEND